VVAFTLVIGAGGVIGSYVRGSFSPIEVVFVVLESAPLWWRRRFPIVVLAVIVCAEVARWALGFSNEPSGPALVFAVYAVSVCGRQRVRLVVAGIAIALIVFAVAFLLLGQFPVSRNLIPAGALSLVAWVIGDYVRSRRRFFGELVARHQQEREQAAEEERLRIARELHDVVAHNVSVIAIQAGAARVSGNSTEETLQSIEQGARDTLAELNKLLGVLRKSPTASTVPGAPERAPQPTLDEVDALLKPVRDAGIGATLKVTGEKRPLAAALDLSAYRIVQEAITNVLKHANASRVEVVIEYQPEGVTLTIADNGNGPGDAPPTGHGLIGMRERVALFGGKMGTGTTPLGGFTVHARLPFKS
jgi:signal transduction histidine kinase